MTIRQLILILLCNIYFMERNFGQCNPDLSPSFECESVAAFCLDQLCFTTLNIPLVCCDNWCGFNTVINNPQYFLFTPMDSEVIIEIHIDDCTNGNGLQCGIIDACPWDNSNIIDCNPGALPGETMTLMPSGLLPGQSYWLLIDGTNGASCNYTITSTAGIAFPDIEDTLDESLSYSSISSVCPGYRNLVLTTAPNIPGAFYQWTFGWNSDTLFTSDSSITIDLDPQSPLGIWDVCVRALNGCDTTEHVCFPVEIETPPPIMISIVPYPDILCPNPIDFASYEWTYCDSTQILGTGPCFAPPSSGCYCLEVENELGCAYKSCTDFILNSTSSITEDEIRIAPNPNSGLVQIDFFQSTLYPAAWQLNDLRGIHIVEGKLTEQSNELNFTSLPSGIYFLKIKPKSNVVLVRKIVIE